ncbi:MFS transporter [Sphingobium phenoxybenzoativorans]|uniref:MFS transporter n=1 Tax=Sphingobium phenoxybenzoativorans TaxID=1592790 RepID=UPI001FE86E49|nr:MFS transporter [Sphingobium phenoxybenzoativorans]
MSADAPEPAEQSGGLPMPRRLLAIIAASFGTALVVIDGSIANVALPTIARDLGVSGSSAVLVVTVYQLVLVMTMLPIAALADRLGHRTLYQYGLILFTVTTILCFFARSLPFLLVVRAAQALGAAAVLSITAVLLRSIYPPKQLGRGLGIHAVISSSASAFAPTLGGLVLGVASWPWIFAAAAPFGIVSMLLGRALPDPEPRERPYDFLGAMLCASTFGLIVSGIESGVHGNSPVVSAAMVLAGILIGRAFVKRELSASEPMLPIDLLAVPALGLAALGGMLCFVSAMTLIVTIPFRLQNEYGLSPGEVGAIFAVWPLTTLILAPLGGALSDRVSVALLCGSGSLIAAVGMLLFAFQPHDATWLDMAWRLSLCGGGFGLFAAPNARSIIAATPVNRTAAAGGLIATNRLLGQTLGATMGAALLAMGFGMGRAPGIVAAFLMGLTMLTAISRFRGKSQSA